MDYRSQIVFIKFRPRSCFNRSQPFSSKFRTNKYRQNSRQKVIGAFGIIGIE